MKKTNLRGLTKQLYTCLRLDTNGAFFSIDVTNSTDFFMTLSWLFNSLLRKEKTVIPYKPEFFSLFFAIAKVVVSSIGTVMISFTINPLYRSSYNLSYLYNTFFYLHPSRVYNEPTIGANKNIWNKFQQQASFCFHCMVNLKNFEDINF